MTDDINLLFERVEELEKNLQLMSDFTVDLQNILNSYILTSSKAIELLSSRIEDITSSWNNRIANIEEMHYALSRAMRDINERVM